MGERTTKDSEVRDNSIPGLLARKRIFVFLGESGCGKTEIAVNFAQAIRLHTDRKINLIDMDQTKQLFRLRDLAYLFQSAEISGKLRGRVGMQPSQSSQVLDRVRVLESRRCSPVRGCTMRR